MKNSNFLGSFFYKENPAIPVDLEKKIDLFKYSSKYSLLGSNSGIQKSRQKHLHECWLQLEIKLENKNELGNEKTNRRHAILFFGFSDLQIFPFIFFQGRQILDIS